MKLYESGEDYLEAILILQKKLGEVRSVDVARYVGVSKPSVCHAVNVLCDGGFLTRDGKHFYFFNRGWGERLRRKFMSDINFLRSNLYLLESALT